MRRLACTFGLGLLSLAACSSEMLGSPTGMGGTTASGGTTGSGGTTASGGISGTGGGGGRSPGMTTLRLTLPPTQSFCDENASCTTTQHLWILDPAGQPFTLGTVGCQVDCSSCSGPPCLETPVIACPAGNFGVPVSSSDFVWDGSYVENGGCEPNGPSPGAAIACVSGKFAPPGMYIARFCATPGTLGTTDGGLQTCTTTGAQECVEVGFGFPATEPVLITLPTD
jgi:hypothetical protein